MGAGRQVAGEAVAGLLRGVVPGEFWVYLFAVMCMLTLLPAVWILIMRAIVKRLVPNPPKPAPLPLPEPGSRQAQHLHRAAMDTLPDDLRTMIGREYQHGSVFGRVYRFYQDWLLAPFLIVVGGMMGWALLLPVLMDGWQRSVGAWDGQVPVADSGNPGGWLYAAIVFICFSMFLIPFGGGVLLLWRSKLRKWLHLGDCPRLQIDAQGVTEEGIFLPWTAIMAVSRRYQHEHGEKERRYVILQEQEEGRAARETKVDTLHLDGVPWNPRWQEAPGENFNWCWLHAMMAYHHAYHGLLARARPPVVKGKPA